MFVTKNTEYHMKDNICVGIRKLKNGLWIKNGKAIKARLIGSIRSVDDIIMAKGTEPAVGEPLLFINDDGEDIVTTTLSEIKRPPKEAVNNYVHINNMTFLDDETSSNVGAKLT